MTRRSLELSLALHGALLSALLLPAAGRDPVRHARAQPGRTAVLLEPPDGTDAAPGRGPDSPGRGETKRPGSPVALDAVTVVVDDRHAAALTAVLARWNGKLTACPAGAPGMLRFWLYDPAQWPETRGWRGIPCADFPAEFRAELNARISAEAARRGLKAVCRVVVGFSQAAPGGVVVLEIEE
ncbi:MAG: hypothetical protein LAP87_18455 [Acidobacteriia bacterium]|nr:hypothetical protein [Terriglobia bacterium]